MQHLAVRGVSVLVVAWVLGAAAPAHADLNDVTGEVTGSVAGAGQAVQQTTQKTVEQVKQKVTQQAPAPDPGPTVAKVTGSLAGAATKAAAPAPSAAPTRQQPAPARQATPVRSGAGPRASGPRETVRRHARTGGNATAGGRVRTDRGRPRHGSRPAARPPAPPSAMVLAASLVHVPARPAAAPAPAKADPSLPAVGRGCSTPSLDPAELRRCAFASVLGPTGGFAASLPLAGLLVLAVGVTMATRGRRATVEPA